MSKPWRRDILKSLSGGDSVTVRLLGKIKTMADKAEESPPAAGPQETTEQGDNKTVWQERRIDHLMGIESALTTQLADAKALNQHYEKVLDRLVNGLPPPAGPYKKGLQEMLTETQVEELSREANPLVWLVRGEDELVENYYSYGPYDVNKDAHLEFFTSEPETDE